MRLVGGTRLGPYEILSEIGVGGMGEVYRARDHRLSRDVALKVLPDLVAADPDRLARFQREAQLLASLNHPHIAAIYGLEESGGVRALVLELVDGPTLADRIAQGPLPLDVALPIARQIADALEAAHEQGVIHRDLKPANVKMRADGTVKVLDFGLAKAIEPIDVTEGSSPAGPSQSPTLTSPALTRMGVILGTAAYMSPEQARAAPVEKRTDIWAFGCVLYEMLAGARAFEGDNVTDTLAAVVRADPDWRRLPPETPAAIRRLLQRCLQKDRRARLRDIGDARIDIDEAQIEPHSHDDGVQRASSRRERIVWGSALALVTVVAGVFSVVALRPASPAPEFRLEITTPRGTDNLDSVSIAISPNGQIVAFVAASEGLSRLWIRPLNSAAARPISGTNGATLPFWSPDNRSIAFFAEGKLKRVDVDGGSVQVLANASVGRGGTWNRDGTILFTPTNSSPILRVTATGGEAALLTRLETQQQNHVFPQFLPDGRHFLFYVLGTPGTRGVYVGHLDGGQPRRLLDADGAAVYASLGRLLFVRQGTLFAQTFDTSLLEPTGNPFSVAEQVLVSGGGSAGLSASLAGPIVYRSGLIAGLRQPVWVDRLGREIAKLGEPISGAALNPSLSPDGRRLILQRTVDTNIDIWQLELARGTLSRVVSNPALDVNPLWSPDGRRIVFGSNRKGPVNLYLKSATGSGSEDLVLESPHTISVMDWSPDGQLLLYRDADPSSGFDIWALSLDGKQRPFPVIHTSADERDAQFSPDGKWLAYGSNESGRFEIYVQRFPGPGAKSLISTNGGAQARWRRDGKELFYITLDGRLTAVPVRLDPAAQTVDAGAPMVLFAAHIGNAVPSVDRQEYIVSEDGQRFLLNMLTDESSSPITVVLNLRTKP